MASQLVDGTKVRADLMAMAKRRQEHLSAADKIGKEIEKIGLDPETLLPRKKTKNKPLNGYTDMASSRLAILVLDFAGKHSGKVAVADVTKLLDSRKVKCSPYVLLTRMVKANMLHRIGRGSYRAA